ncbi:cytokine receptor common subunit beta-like [Astyanax mexicanus]|uniref:Cytokine receptor common subunit beta-like n=1 Tax=Astyanax mexicanus TaxID=7994 RepID=A0A8T2KZZ3_ASTMX|nr:cytokine receptor common subunit beta-like [Astyanax mexicanus]
MMPVRMLLVSVLPLLVQSSEIQQGSFHSTTQDMPPALDSVECYNDYTSHIRCTWEEYPHGNSNLVVEGSKWEDIKECGPDGPAVRLSNGKLHRSCVYKTRIFSLNSRTFYLNTTCAPKTTTLNIAQHGKVLSPVNLTVKEVKGEGRILSWNSAYSASSNLSHTLTYQLKYKRHGHDWTVLDNITATQMLIKEQELVAAYSYEARVRARGPVGLWSDWSTPVSWVTEEEAVFNLQCVIEERGVSCSWRVKREHAQFLSYHLCGQTSESNQFCQHCVSHTKRPDHAVLDYTCSVDSPEPERLTVELKTVHRTKNIPDFLNVKPPQTDAANFKVKKKDGLWSVTWSKPKVHETLDLCYELRLRDNGTQAETYFNFTQADFSAEFTPSSLRPDTTFMVQVRSLPCEIFEGQPSDWSDPVFFKNDPASRIFTIIYCLIGVVIAVVFLILYNAFPACHRRVERWEVSIPSPFKSRVLEEMSSRRSPAGWGYVCSENEKTSVCIMQPSDNPTIYKGSISECPLLPYMEDSLIKTGWMSTPDHSAPYTEGSGMSVSSVMSFSGPYIFCRQDSSQTEILEASSFYSDSTDCTSIDENPKDSPPVNGGYVSSPPTAMPSAGDSAPPDYPANESTNPGLSQLPEHDPPAYTPNPTAVPGAIFTHPSGYCMMPNIEADVAARVQTSAPPPGGDTKSQSNDAGEDDQRARGYVTLSEPKT